MTNLDPRVENMLKRREAFAAKGFEKYLKTHWDRIASGEIPSATRDPAYIATVMSLQWQHIPAELDESAAADIDGMIADARLYSLHNDNRAPSFRIPLKEACIRAKYLRDGISILTPIFRNTDNTVDMFVLPVMARPIEARGDVPALLVPQKMPTGFKLAMFVSGDNDPEPKTSEENGRVRYVGLVAECAEGDAGPVAHYRYKPLSAGTQRAEYYGQWEDGHTIWTTKKFQINAL